MMTSICALNVPCLFRGGRSIPNLRGNDALGGGRHEESPPRHQKELAGTRSSFLSNKKRVTRNVVFGSVKRSCALPIVREKEPEISQALRKKIHGTVEKKLASHWVSVRRVLNEESLARSPCSSGKIGPGPGAYDPAEQQRGAPPHGQMAFQCFGSFSDRGLIPCFGGSIATTAGSATRNEKQRAGTKDDAAGTAGTGTAGSGVGSERTLEAWQKAGFRNVAASQAIYEAALFRRHPTPQNLGEERRIEAVEARVAPAADVERVHSLVPAGRSRLRASEDLALRSLRSAEESGEEIGKIASIQADGGSVFRQTPLQVGPVLSPCEYVSYSFLPTLLDGLCTLLGPAAIVRKEETGKKEKPRVPFLPSSVPDLRKRGCPTVVVPTTSFSDPSLVLSETQLVLFEGTRADSEPDADSIEDRIEVSPREQSPRWSPTVLDPLEKKLDDDLLGKGVYPLGKGLYPLGKALLVLSVGGKKVDPRSGLPKAEVPIRREKLGIGGRAGAGGPAGGVLQAGQGLLRSPLGWSVRSVPHGGWKKRKWEAIRRLKVQARELHLLQEETDVAENGGVGDRRAAAGPTSPPRDLSFPTRGGGAGVVPHGVDQSTDAHAGSWCGPACGRRADRPAYGTHVGRGPGGRLF